MIYLVVKERGGRMFGILRNRKGFTLVELIVVVMIVGILAAVALPMMTGNINKARRAEAMAGCGTLRTAARLYMVEHPGNVPTKTDLVTYVTANDLNGTYYSDANYTCTGGNIQATGASGWVNLTITPGTMTDG